MPGTTAIKFKKLILLSGDIMTLYLSLWLALYLRFGFYTENIKVGFDNPHFAPFTVIYLTWLLVFYIIGLYDLNIARNNINFFTILFKALIANTAISIAFFYFILYFGITPKTVLFLNIATFTFLFVLWRQIYNRLLISDALLNNILIIGETKETRFLTKFIEANPQLGYKTKRVVQPKEIALIYDLINYIAKDKIQTVVSAIDPHKDQNLVRNLYHCLPLDITLYELPNFYEKITGRVPISAIEEIWFLENLMMERKKLYQSVKRTLDIIYALTLGLITLPLYPFIALATKIDSPGPIFLKQKRVGENSKIFDLIKFRSMFALTPDGSAEKNGAQFALKKDPRVTRFGRFLRNTRLDELPQLLNVLKGDMSFVGPRPERPEFVFGVNLQRQISFYQIRHLVRPGLTGWAQINFEYGASLEDTIEKLQYDLFYIKNYSFILDLEIILKTAKIVLSAGGR